MSEAGASMASMTAAPVRSVERRFVLTAPGTQGPRFLPDADQQRVLEHRGPAVVTGGPGTGKTATLVELVARRVEAGCDLDRIIVLTHGRAAAHRLRAQILARLGRTESGTSIMTLHGLCRALLGRYEAEPRLLTAPEQDFRIRELLSGHDTSRWPEEVRAAATTRTFAAQLRAAITRARQLGLDPSDLVRLGAIRDTWAAVGEFFEEYLDVIDAEGVLDYAELVHRTRLVLLDDAVRASILSEHQVLVMDEFAECDPSQWHLVADLALAGLDVVVFADPSTRLFGFRGADERAVPDYLDTIAALSPDRLVLGGAHRLTGGIARAVDAVAAGHASEEISSDAVCVRLTGDPASELRDIAARLTMAHVDEGIGWADMAVVCRSGGSALAIVARGLAAEGIPVDVDGNDLVLGTEPALRPVLAGLRLARQIAVGEDPGEEAMTAWLASPLIGIDPVSLRAAGRTLAATGADRSPAALVGRMAAGEAVDLDACGPIGARLRAAAELLTAVSQRIARGAGVHEALWALWSGSTWPGVLEEEALAGGETSRRAHRDLDAVVALFDLAGRMETLAGDRGVQALLDAVDTQEIPFDTTRESNVRDEGVALVTAHGAKGREWQVVVVQGIQEGSWPVRRVRPLLLDPGELDPRLVHAGRLVPETRRQAVAASIADDRRALVLAMSRASRELVLSACEADELDLTPSRFLATTGVASSRILDPAPRFTSLVQIVARLRATAADPEQEPGVREAAANRLARISLARDDQGRSIARGADPASWWGVSAPTRGVVPLVRPGRPPSLSGSELESIVTCPRRWFLSKRARAEQQRTEAQGFGTLVHLLAALVAQGEIGADEVPERLDLAWPRLSFAAPWQGAAERLAAGEAMDRFLLWQEQRPFTLLGVEVPFRQEVLVDAAPVLLKGTADRVELDDAGRLRIVDFKTGRRPATKPEAQASPQLGLYQLAAAAGAFDDVSGGVRRLGGAELVYLRSGDRSGLPKSLAQDSLDDHPWPDWATDARASSPDSARPTWVHDLLAEAVRILTTECTDALANPSCRHCPFRVDCPALGLRAPTDAPTGTSHSETQARA